MTEPEECKCGCHSPSRAMMHMVPCCWRCPRCKRRFVGAPIFGKGFKPVEHTCTPETP